MELLGKLERKILSWVKSIPHLPTNARKWLGNNVWWIALVGAILGGIAVLFSIINLFGAISLLGTVAASYYVASNITGSVILSSVMGILFSVITVVLLATAIKPLQHKQKKGWVLLFALWLLGAIGVVVSAVVSFSPFVFVTTLIFGAVWLAISGYFLFEMHGEFAHVEKSKGVKAAK